MANNDEIKNLENELKTVTSAQSVMEKLGKSLTQQFTDAGKILNNYFSLSSGVTFLISQVKGAVSELKNLDSILTSIGRTTNLTQKELKNLGDSAFEAASRYGISANSYLTNIQEMYRAGVKNAKQLSELSVLAQTAGGLDSSTANSYLLASNAAYDLKENITDLNAILDGQNNITNHTAVNLNDLALATTEAASAAAQYGVQANELSALIAASAAKTRESGSETGIALKELFANLQDTTSRPVREAFESVNISMTEMANGSETLKTPIQLLEELAEVFSGLGENDSRRTDIMSAIGGENGSDALAALLSDWSSYEQMLDYYSQGMGSAAKDAENYANSWEGSLNRLSNTWTDTIENIADSDVIITGINSLNGLLEVVNDVTGALGSVGTIGLGAGLAAGIKNVGRDQMFSLQSNMPIIIGFPVQRMGLSYYPL